MSRLRLTTWRRYRLPARRPVNTQPPEAAGSFCRSSSSAAPCRPTRVTCKRRSVLTDGEAHPTWWLLPPSGTLWSETSYVSTWPSEGRHEKEREEELAEVRVRLVTAAGPAHRNQRHALTQQRHSPEAPPITHAFVPPRSPPPMERHRSRSPR